MGPLLSSPAPGLVQYPTQRWSLFCVIPPAIPLAPWFCILPDPLLDRIAVGSETTLRKNTSRRAIYSTSSDRWL